MDLTTLTLLETRDLLASGQTSASDVTQAYLDRIAHLDDKIGAYLRVNPHAAAEAAAAKTGTLAGLPIAYKDCYCTAGIETTAASKILSGYVPPHDAVSVARLKAAGAVTLGKTNTDEFTMGGSTENSAFQLTKNPWDVTRVPGGSSGGSAAAVAADLCVAAMGTDTGGSIRQPASFCNIVGLKLTYGRIPRSGVIAMASSLDTVGVLTKRVADAAAMLQILAGHDVTDATSGQTEVLDYTAALADGVAGKRIGIPKEYFSEALDAKVAAVIRAGIEKLRELGAEIVDVSLPHTAYAVPAYYLIVASEVSANMARYDGLRFGPAGSGENLIETYFDARTRGFGAEVKRRIMLGTFALSAGYADAYYKKALRVRTLIKQDFEKAFAQVDLLAAPVAPSTAWKIGEKINDPLQMYLEDIFTTPVSLAGMPAISVPAGFVEGLPVGLQIVGPQWGEPQILAAAHAYEQATEWHLAKPVIQ